MSINHKITLAVIGTKNSGKTSFIKNLLHNTTYDTSLCDNKTIFDDKILDGVISYYNINEGIFKDYKILEKTFIPEDITPKIINGTTYYECLPLDNLYIFNEAIDIIVLVYDYTDKVSDQPFLIKVIQRNIKLYKNYRNIKFIIVMNKHDGNEKHINREIYKLYKDKYQLFYFSNEIQNKIFNMKEKKNLDYKLLKNFKKKNYYEPYGKPYGKPILKSLVKYSGHYYEKIMNYFNKINDNIIIDREITTDTYINTKLYNIFNKNIDIMDNSLFKTLMLYNDNISKLPPNTILLRFFRTLLKKYYNMDGYMNFLILNDDNFITDFIHNGKIEILYKWMKILESEGINLIYSNEENIYKILEFCFIPPNVSLINYSTFIHGVYNFISFLNETAKNTNDYLINELIKYNEDNLKQMEKIMKNNSM